MLKLDEALRQHVCDTETESRNAPFTLFTREYSSAWAKIHNDLRWYLSSFEGKQHVVALEKYVYPAYPKEAMRAVFQEVYGLPEVPVIRG